MSRVPIDRTENDPEIFRETLQDFERGPLSLPDHLRPRDSRTGRFTKKENSDG